MFSSIFSALCMCRKIRCDGEFWKNFGFQDQLNNALAYVFDRLSRWLARGRSIMLMHAKRERACIDNIKITPTLPERAPFPFFFPFHSSCSSYVRTLQSFYFQVLLILLLLVLTWIALVFEFSGPVHEGWGFGGTQTHAPFFSRNSEPSIVQNFRSDEASKEERKEGIRESSKRWFH